MSLPLHPAAAGSSWAIRGDAADRDEAATGAVAAAIGRAGIDGVPVELRLRSGPVTVLVELDDGEQRRRRAVGGGPIVDRALLAALWELPHDVPLHRSAVPDWVAGALARSAPPSSSADVSDDGATVRRTARPPLRLRGAMASAIGVDPHRSLAAVCRLSALCPLFLVVDHRLDRHHPALLEAELYGVGVVVRRRDRRAAVMSPAAPVTPTPGPFLWWISELAYAALTGDGTAAPRP